MSAFSILVIFLEKYSTKTYQKKFLKSDFVLHQEIKNGNSSFSSKLILLNDCTEDVYNS